MHTITHMQAFKTIEQGLAVVLQCIHERRWHEAEDVCRQLLHVDDRNAESHHLAGHVAGQLGNEEKALEHLIMAIALDPRHPQYRYNYAVSLGLLGRENEAAIQYQACLRQNPNHSDALWNYGEILRLSEHFDLAAQLLERFAANGGNYRSLDHRLGVVYGALGRDAQADLHFLKELNVSSYQVDALTQWEYSLFLLSRERFAEGFSYYRHRFQTGGRNSVYCHVFEQPLWDGQFTKKGTLLIHGEQGLGDEMMFASILPEVLAAANAAHARVILAVKPPLVRLFALSFSDAIVVPHRVGGPVADVSHLGAIDWQVAMGDLPMLFRGQLQDFQKGCSAYLQADPARAAWYGAHLDAVESSVSLYTKEVWRKPKLRVGLMWGSNPAAINAKFMRWSQQRSIPIQLFEQLAAVLHDVQFVSLQNAERGHEAALAPRLDILDLSHLQTDFLETASLIANLDLVISVDTSISHLAGAMGKETWVPIIHRSDWRHGNKREKSYWYPNTRYFHQSEDGEWATVMTALAEALAVRVLRLRNIETSEALSTPSSLITTTSTVSTKSDVTRAITFLAARDFESARPYFEKALAASPDDPRVQWEYAMQLLTEGQWDRGWRFHEARHSVFGTDGLNMCPLPWPRWRGEPLRGKTIVVHGEQGIGDEIMYLSMLPDLLTTGAKVILACVPSLVEIFQYSFPMIEVVAHPRGSAQSWSKAMPFWVQSKLAESIDFQIPIASLGQYFRNCESDFPRKAYLRADPDRIASMARQLNEATRDQATPTEQIPLRIGLAWCGSLGDENARARSMPLKKLQELIDVGKSRGWQFVSLQSRQYASQLNDQLEFQIVDMSEYTDDFADLAALMLNLDRVICVDTSYGHLAGALGVTTWRMVIRTCDWRWGWGRDDSVWYPHDRLFRQPKNGDWDTVIQRIASELKNLPG
jgi:ADP-heptose:LPS heptosyltransferase/Tfp pilus assembly protein PilF